jgi:hypothetical protein
MPGFASGCARASPGSPSTRTRSSCPAFPLLDGIRQRVLVLEPLKPESFEDPEALHGRLADVIGGVVSEQVVQTYPRPVDPGRSKRVHA